MDVNKIDQHLNAVLRAAGSALRHYSPPKSLDDMRAGMKAAIDDATSDLQGARRRTGGRAGGAGRASLWLGKARNSGSRLPCSCAPTKTALIVVEMVWEAGRRSRGERWQKYESEARHD